MGMSYSKRKEKSPRISSLSSPVNRPGNAYLYCNNEQVGIIKLV